MFATTPLNLILLQDIASFWHKEALETVLWGSLLGTSWFQWQAAVSIPSSISGISTTSLRPSSSKWSSIFLLSTPGASDIIKECLLSHLNQVTSELNPNLLCKVTIFSSQCPSTLPLSKRFHQVWGKECSTLLELLFYIDDGQHLLIFASLSSAYVTSTELLSIWTLHSCHAETYGHYCTVEWQNI